MIQSPDLWDFRIFGFVCIVHSTKSILYINWIQRNILLWDVLISTHWQDCLDCSSVASAWYLFWSIIHYARSRLVSHSMDQAWVSIHWLFPDFLKCILKQSFWSSTMNNTPTIPIKHLPQSYNPGGPVSVWIFGHSKVECSYKSNLHIELILCHEPHR